MFVKDEIFNGKFKDNRTKKKEGRYDEKKSINVTIVYVFIGKLIYFSQCSRDC